MFFSFYWPSLFGQDGWILALFFLCVFMDHDGVKVHKPIFIQEGGGRIFLKLLLVYSKPESSVSFML